MKLTTSFIFCCLITMVCNGSDKKSSSWSFPIINAVRSSFTNKESKENKVARLSKSFPSNDWTDLGDDVDETQNRPKTPSPDFMILHQEILQNPMLLTTNQHKNEENLKLPDQLKQAIQDTSNRRLKRTPIKPQSELQHVIPATDVSQPVVNNMVQSMHIERDTSMRPAPDTKKNSPTFNNLFIQICCNCLPMVTTENETSKKKINS